jgi:hypothetical protein
MNTAIQRQAERTLHANAPPSAVFPLLCPVRERDWIDGWTADVLRSASGFAELGCVFRARGATFVVTRYEPPARIEFAIFDGASVETLAIRLAAAQGGTDMTWTRCFTALTPEGGAWIEANVPQLVYDRLGGLEEMMNAYLARS